MWSPGGGTSLVRTFCVPKVKAGYLFEGHVCRWSGGRFARVHSHCLPFKERELCFHFQSGAPLVSITRTLLNQKQATPTALIFANLCSTAIHSLQLRLCVYRSEHLRTGSCSDASNAAVVPQAASSPGADEVSVCCCVLLLLLLAEVDGSDLHLNVPHRFLHLLPVDPHDPCQQIIRQRSAHEDETVNRESKCNQCLLERLAR